MGYNKIQKKINNIDVAICAAAVSDWAIKNPSKNKIKKNNKNFFISIYI